MLKFSDPVLQQYVRGLLGDPEKDAGVYDAASPIKYIRNVRAPLLVLQGENDPRVPKEEAQQVVDLLKRDGKTVDVHYYPNEGHGFAKRENQIDSITRSIEWFDRHLKSRNPTPERCMAASYGKSRWRPAAPGEMRTCATGCRVASPEHRAQSVVRPADAPGHRVCAGKEP